MKTLKVAVIGGGSSYTPELVDGFIQRREALPLAELRLVDVPEGREKVEIIAGLTRRMLDRAGMQARVSVHFDRRAALEGVDFVVSQFRVGGLDARALDERIPLKYGALGQETTGAGGFFKALRTIPVILDVCRDMEKVAPGAWLINFTNPAGILTEAVLRHSRVRVLGLCNNPINMTIAAANILGVEPSRVFLQFMGLNHLVWARVYLDGRDVTARVLEAMAPAAGTPANVAALPYDREFLLGMGYMPCPYHRYFYMLPEMLQKEIEAAGGQGTRAEVVKRTEAELFRKYSDPGLDVKPPELAKRGGAHYSEAAVSLIDAIANDRREVHAVNTRNNGALADLPGEAAVEVSALVGAHGAVPLTVGHLPPQLRGLLQHVKAYEELTIAAAVSGDPSLALQALAANPLVPSVAVAKQLWAEMSAAHARYLPQFAGR
ncbi:6-phospho-beta-glucosidase [Symbiobacterium terraclitae]|uniref:6-phospho-beta-glucosidase n=1 Tax=Symbiobacterium terraclitae TaxID=557451 RepID=A0ABS4JPM9_9FIRM|nr:6-phospho-beta-glucosidase [Symbiobacterium terraclitae]